MGLGSIALLQLWPIMGGLFLGWALGANHVANIFGTAVASRVITYRLACLLCGVGVIAGAYFQGEAGIATYRELADQTMLTILVATIATALCITAMTRLGLPVCTSQAIVGAIVGIGIPSHSLNLSGLEKIVTCWVAAPLMGIVSAYVFYLLIGFLLTKIPMSLLTRDKILWGGLIIVGIYGAYALGANAVANATGLFSGQLVDSGVTDSDLAVWGGIAIALGTMTYGRRVIQTIGSGILPMDAFTGFVATTAMSMTVHVFALVGVPISTSQCIVGAVVGVGFARQSPALQLPSLKRILLGWVMTPVLALILSAAGYALFCV